MQNVKPAKSILAQGGRNQQTFLLVIIGVAVALVAIFIIVSSSSRSNFDEAFFAGIHQERLDDGGFILGDPDAAITIVEFQDWYCAHCQNYKPTADQFIREYVATGKARYEFRALTTAGANAQPNTSQVYNLLECVEVAKPGSFFYASDIAYDLVINGVRGSEFSSVMAERTGVDYAEMLRCTQDTADQITVDSRLANNIGVTSTPSVFYRLNGGTPIPVSDRSFSALAAIVETVGQ